MCYRVIVNHVILIYGKILIYTHQMSLCTQLIDPSAIKPYYSMSVWHVEVCSHTQVRCTPLMNEPLFSIAIVHDINLTYWNMQTYESHMYPKASWLLWIVQNDTTPCHFDMWEGADRPRSGWDTPESTPVLQRPTT